MLFRPRKMTLCIRAISVAFLEALVSEAPCECQRWLLVLADPKRNYLESCSWGWNEFEWAICPFLFWRHCPRASGMIRFQGKDMWSICSNGKVSRLHCVFTSKFQVDGDALSYIWRCYLKTPSNPLWFDFWRDGAYHGNTWCCGVNLVNWSGNFPLSFPYPSAGGGLFVLLSISSLQLLVHWKNPIKMRWVPLSNLWVQEYEATDECEEPHEQLETT